MSPTTYDITIKLEDGTYAKHKGMTWVGSHEREFFTFSGPTKSFYYKTSQIVSIEILTYKHEQQPEQVVSPA